MATIAVTFEDGRRQDWPSGSPVGSLAPTETPASGLPYIAAMVNNDVSSMSYPLSVNCHVRFLTMADPHGWRIYRRSLSFILAQTVRKLYPDAVFAVEHSFGPGLYCRFHAAGAEGDGIDTADLERLAGAMRDQVERNVPIERHKIAYMDAVRDFEDAGQIDKLNLLRHRNPPHVVVHVCEGFSDLAHGPLVPRTGVLNRFELLHHKSGFVLHLPPREDPQRLPPFEDQPHLFQIFQEHKEWGRILDVTTIGRLNRIIEDDGIGDFIGTVEALHEKKIARVADRIAADRERIRVILVAGPSCAGKTTFTKRLSTQLKVNGMRPLSLGVDDYFVGDNRNPRDTDGKPDYEHIEAVDLELFNEHLAKLVSGQAIELPRFNFETKQREVSGHKLHIDGDQVLIIEGIHGLNPMLTHLVPTESKFRIYVSALTQLNLDSNNRISTTDNRLMRRLVRDHRYRGYSALETLRRWPSVRRGEKRWIFPFQREADATFNSALDYELPVLKPLVEPLLMQVKPSHPEYAESRRLTEFLLNVLAIPDLKVPANSILREYIGGSTFRY